MFRRFLFDGASIEIGVIPIQRSLSAWYFRNCILGRLSNMKLIKAGETTAARRYVFFQLVGTDGITAVTTGEAGNRPSVSLDGAAWVSTASEIGTLVHIGNGRYYAELTSSVLVAGRNIETRYKSANTAECPGDSVQVVAFDPFDATRLGLSALPNADFGTSTGLRTANDISDAVLSRNVSNVEGTMGEHTLGTIVLATLENAISGTTLTIYRTNGTTTHATKTLTKTAASTADVITGVA